VLKNHEYFEGVLFNTLAQIGKKDIADAIKKSKRTIKRLSSGSHEGPVTQKVDVQFEP